MTEFEVIDTAVQPAITIKSYGRVSELSAIIRRDLRELASYARREGVRIIGPPFAFFHGWSLRGIDIESGYPIAGEARAGGHIQLFSLPPSRAVTALHIGPYEGVRELYSLMERWMLGKGLTPAAFFWEVYITDPVSADEGMTTVRIIWPFR